MQKQLNMNTTLSEKISKFSKTEIENLIKGIMLSEMNGNEEIDERKCFDFEIVETERSFKISYNWIYGIYNGGDFHFDEVKQTDGEFIIIKSETTKKLVSYVQDMLNEVNKDEYFERNYEERYFYQD